MRFILNPCIFNNLSNRHELTLFLFKVCDKRNHFIKIVDIDSQSYRNYMDDLKKFGEISYLTVCNKVDNDDRDFFVYPSALYEVKDIPGKNEINLKQALSLIETPFKVFLENGRNDKNFLLFYSLNDQIKHLQDLINTNEIIFEHGGGIGELRVMVQDKKLNNDRCYFMFDSDALPLHEDIINKDAKFIVEKCIERGIKFTMLKRRFIENYIPNACFYNYVESKKGTEKSKLKKLFTNFTSISCESTKRFYNIKKGLEGDYNQFKKKMTYEQFNNKYYKNIPIGERYIYKSGFGSDVSKVYEEQIHISEELKRRDFDAWKEVNGIVSEILRIA